MVIVAGELPPWRIFQLDEPVRLIQNMVLPLYYNLMDTSGLLPFIIFSALLLTRPFTCAYTVCGPASPCDQTGPMIRPPFWRKGIQPDSCEYPGYELSCNRKNETILRIPGSGDFVVKDIDYAARSILLNDPDTCPPKTVENFTFGYRFRPLHPMRYQFFNCSSNLTSSVVGLWHLQVPLSCLADRNHTIYAVPYFVYDQGMRSSCEDLNSNGPPFSWWSTSDYWMSKNPQGDLQLRWRDPRCRSCRAQGLSCRYDGEFGCVSPPEESENGLPRSAKYGIIIGIGIPALLVIIGLVCHIGSRVKAYSIQRRLATELSATITPQPAIIVTGLDGETIDSYPKTVLGESRRLPKPSDNTCPICLCEYQPSETLRTIPDCNHYFHADCIDEWLKLNGTCPLCRNSPESLPITPCSSISSVTTTTTTTTTTSS